MIQTYHKAMIYLILQNDISHRLIRPPPTPKEKKKKKKAINFHFFATFKQGRAIASFIYPCLYGAKNVHYLFFFFLLPASTQS